MPSSTWWPDIFLADSQRGIGRGCFWKREKQSRWKSDSWGEYVWKTDWVGGREKEDNLERVKNKGDE